MHICRLIAIAGILFLPFPAKPQLSVAGLPSHFGIANGLPDADIECMAQDDDGFLWIGTANGLSRYDGSSFTNFYHTDAANSLPGNRIHSIIQLPGHHLLVSTNTGLAIYDTRLHTSRNLLIQSSTDMFPFENDFVHTDIDAGGHIWAGTCTTLYQLDSGLNILQQFRGWSKKDYNTTRFLYVQSVIPLPGGGILAELQNTRLGAQYFAFEPGAPSLKPLDSLPRHSLAGFASGIFMADDTREVFHIRMAGDSIFYTDTRTHRTRAFLAGKKIAGSEALYGTVPTQLHDGWLSVSLPRGGIALFDTRRNYTPADIRQEDMVVLKDQVANCLYYDDDNNCWAGTRNGLYKLSVSSNRFTEKKFSDADAKNNEPLELGKVYRNGNRLVLSSSGGGLFYKDNDAAEWKQLQLPGGPGVLDTWNIRASGADTCWIGTQQGLYWWCPRSSAAGRLLLKGMPRSLSTLPVTTQFTDSHGLVWMGMGYGYGVLQYDTAAKTLAYFAPGPGKNNCPIRYPTCIAEDEEENLWMGGQDGMGLVKYTRATNSFSLIVPAYNTPFSNGNIYCLCCDKQGTVWIGTTDGLSRLNIHTGVFEKFDMTDGLPSNQVFSICEDSRRNFWIGTKNGLCYFDRQRQQVMTIPESNAPASREILDLYYCGRENTLYVLSVKSLYSFNPQTVFTRNKAPVMVLTALEVSGRQKSVAALYRLPHDQNSLTISFTGIQLSAGWLNTYYYRLQGVSDNWINIGGQRQVNLSNLAPGNYTFEVKVSNNGQWSKSTAGFTFSIAPPFWKTAWFDALLLLLAAGLLYGLYRYRINQLLRLQTVRNRIAGDLHDDIGASLTNINILAELSRRNSTQPGDSEKFLQRIAEEVQQSAQSLDDIVWSINASHDTMEQIIVRMRRYAAELLDSANVSYELHIDPRLANKRINMGQRRDIYLAFKESLNNIYKHAEATEVHIHLYIEGPRLVMIIRDNGKGFDTSRPTGRNGLASISQRTRRWKGVATIESEIDKGTLVRFSISLG